MTFEIGTILSIDKDFSKESEEYRSKIIDIGPGHIMIDYPTHIKTGRTSFFLDGTKLSISFVDKLKNIYKFNTEVSGRRMDGVPMLKISYSGDQQLIKVQRREYVRIQTELDVSVLKDGKYTQLVTTDISAGGIKLNLSVANFNEKDSLSLIIVLPFLDGKIKYVRAKAEIVRISVIRNGCVASIKFDEIGTNDRQHIVRYCFEQELKLRNG